MSRAPSTPRGRVAGRVCAAALALALVQCSSASTDPTSCPAAVIAPDAGAWGRFAPDSTAENPKVVIAVKIADATDVCDRAEKMIDVTTALSFTAVRSSALIADGAVTYFVAVADAQRRILNKQTFDIPVKFLPGENYRIFRDQTVEHIPITSGAQGANYLVIVGFQLTPEQLEFNRAHPPK